MNLKWKRFQTWASRDFQRLHAVGMEALEVSGSPRLKKYFYITDLELFSSLVAYEFSLKKLKGLTLKINKLQTNKTFPRLVEQKIFGNFYRLYLRTLLKQLKQRIVRKTDTSILHRICKQLRLRRLGQTFKRFRIRYTKIKMRRRLRLIRRSRRRIPRRRFPRKKRLSAVSKHLNRRRMFRIRRQRQKLKLFKLFR